MIKLDNRGGLNALLIPLILVSLLFLGALYFGYWAYNSRQDYKNNTDQKISVAVASAIKSEDAKQQTQYNELEKKPLRVYHGPSAYGSILLSYPKTWSGYVSDDTNGSLPVDGYFYPGIVPDIQGQSNSFAVRLQVVAESYDQVMRDFQNNVSLGTATVKPYSFPKVPSIIGSRVDGAIEQNRQGSMIVVPLRDKTLKLWTEASSFMNDFNNNILPNFTFSP